MKNPYGVQKFRRKPLRRRRQYSAESSASRKGWMRGPRGAGIQTHFERGPQKPRASIPVDVECRERFEAVAQAKRWTAFQRSAHRTFHVGDEDWESLFTPPQIPPQVKERLRSAGALDGKDKFREKGAQTLESSLFDVDRASRAGMKYSSALLLFAELLNRSFQQAQASGISRKDTAAIIALLGPVSRMVLDQFARVSVKATLTRRDLVLNSLNWSSRSTADAFRNLPILGRTSSAASSMKTPGGGRENEISEGGGRTHVPPDLILAPTF
ncbi:hypothetical protein BSL78_08375 [Apostichopus japonicus]|uniref:Uncharacterized protein n=1 Tax=Stichopus japonicus TaxID=307972 RepID=A0A2G8L393_STIJA|nr:hypothetical protein BSL78_08375 [Apostichopus japonicus]